MNYDISYIRNTIMNKGLPYAISEIIAYDAIKLLKSNKSNISEDDIITLSIQSFHNIQKIQERKREIRKEIKCNIRKTLYKNIVIEYKL